MAVGFLGMGIMGRGMAANLLRTGHELVIWNRTPSRTQSLVDIGAEAADSPAEVGRRCPVVMVCVSDTPDVREVALGAGGLIEGLSAGSLVVDHSTISPQATREFADAVGKVGASWIDAPVSGGSEGAERGTLSIMVGGAVADFERARPLMEAFGTTITHVGGVGDGQTVKLVNQILVVGNQMAVSEAMLFAKAAGLDLSKTLDAVKGGAAASWMLSNRGPQMIAGDWSPGFTIDLQQKDLRLVLESADQMGIPALSTALVFNLYRSLQARGLGGDGNHALIKALEALSGLEIGEA